MRTPTGYFSFFSLSMCLFFAASSGHCEAFSSISSKNWTLTIDSYQDNQSNLPFAKGALTLLVPKTHEGIVMRGQIKPIAGNANLVVKLEEFAIFVNGKESLPFGVEITKQKSDELIPVRWPKGHSNEFNEEDFPADISIYYMIDPGNVKTFTFDGATPVSLPFASK